MFKNRICLLFQRKKMVEKQSLMRSENFACFLFVSLTVLLLYLVVLINEEQNVNIITNIHAKISGLVVSDEGNNTITTGLPYIYYNGNKLYIHPTDNSEGVVWGGKGNVTGAQSNTDGSANTATIVRSLGTGNYAAQICSDLSFGGYDDWYLPAKDQLKEIYLQIDNISKGGYAEEWTGFSLLSLGFYWSSTESSDNPGNEAGDVSVNDGTTGNFDKDTRFIIRCVRDDKIEDYCGDGSCNNGENSQTCVSDCDSSSGGSTGEHIISEGELIQGYTKTIARGQSIKFKIDGQDHTLEVMSINSSYAIIKVQSESQIRTILLGSEEKFELTGDDYYDLSVKLNSIMSNKATLTLKKISEKMIVFDLSGTENASEIIQNESVTSLDNSTKENSPPWLIISIASLVILIVLIFLIVFIRVKKKHNSASQFELTEDSDSNAIKIQDKFDEARRFVLDARSRGYTNEQIRKGFEDKGWKRTDIDNILE